MSVFFFLERMEGRKLFNLGLSWWNPRGPGGFLEDEEFDYILQHVNGVMTIGGHSCTVARPLWWLLLEDYNYNNYIIYIYICIHTVQKYIYVYTYSVYVYMYIYMYIYIYICMYSADTVHSRYHSHLRKELSLRDMPWVIRIR